MSTANLLMAILIALCFAGWPIIGKYSQSSGAWVATLVGAGTALAIALLSSRQLSSSTPTAKAFAILAIAGVINGTAVYFYAVKTSDLAVPTGIFVLVVAVLIACWAPLLDWALNGTIISLRQTLGLACATMAIYLLGK